MNGTPAARLRVANEAGVAAGGGYVLYWMTAQRRTRWNFALDHTLARARELGKGLVVLEALRCDHPWASERFHRFVLEGMADNARRLAGSGVFYFAYLERGIGEGRGLLEALAGAACCVVTDDFPCFFLPRMVEAAARRLPVRLEAVDGNGLLPLAATERVFGRAVDFRRFLQRELPHHLGEAPSPDPLAGLALPAVALPAGVEERWPNLAPALLAGEAISLDRLPIDREVQGVAGKRGGAVAAEAMLERFLAERLPRYVEGRLDLDHRAASELSPWLHFGHLSSHQLFQALTAREGWSPDLLVGPAGGAKEGYWGMSPPAEAFLDEAVTWRELGLNFCAREPGYDRYESLPAWCRATLEKHQNDPRPRRYGLEDFDGARTHDELWNAAQRELRTTGAIHNYLRMLWGKKILEWSATPREALQVMIQLNNRYALDGRDPNSYAGIFWCLGRYDRPWAPERPIFGQIRYMSSDSTRRKTDTRRYLATFGPLALAGSRDQRPTST